MSKGTRRKRNKAFKAQVRAMQAKYQQRQQGQAQATNELPETKRLAKLKAEDKLRTQFKFCKYRSFTGIWCAVHPHRISCNDCPDFETVS